MKNYQWELDGNFLSATNLLETITAISKDEKVDILNISKEDLQAIWTWLQISSAVGDKLDKILEILTKKGIA